ncbi:MAG: hypothetical protein OXG15_03615 [Gammaproteobacteria bacterium]|nr:hypothetical protein [Gammaproteobacteria bacterium]
MKSKSISSSQIASEHDVLVEDIRSWDVESQHRTGTDGDLRTSEMLVKRLTDAGVSARIVEFPFERRVPKDCFVEVGGTRIGGIPLFDGGETDGILEAPLVTAGQDGVIGLGQATANGGPQNLQLLSHRNRDTHEALIGIARSETPGIAMLNADSYTEPLGVPVLIIDGEQANTLQASAQTGATAKLHVNFEIEQSTATNVEVHLAGQSSDLDPLVVMTPKSSWWTSTAERCGGIAAWLASARSLAARTPERDVILTANTGHELGHVGLEYFLSQNPGLARDAHSWVHLGANFAAKGSQIRMQYSNDKLRETFAKYLTTNEVVVASEVGGDIRPGGEARNIFDGGGNYVSLLGSNRLFHHPDDRMSNNVDLEVAMRTRNAVVDLVLELSSAAG